MESTCPECGKPLAHNAVAGLCPECLMKVGLGSQLDLGEFEGGESQEPTNGFLPPKPEELAPHFPQLEILELIGKGGMGAVYKAKQKGLERTVALKVLPPQAGRAPSFAERFTREAQALARLSHPNIVAVHDFGEAGGFYFFVMEFVDGINLRQTLRAQPLSPREAMAIVPQICEALQYAHDQGIVHRDIKPENILLDKAGRVKVADFGIAKLLGRNSAERKMTGHGDVMGTPNYMAPEQIEKPTTVDHRADIYALGVVFYELLTGELPLGRFAPPSRKVHIDVRLDEVVLRALEKEPELRYQQASQLKTQIETIAQTPERGAGSALSKGPTSSGGEAGARRFSRTAIVGAVWAALAPVPFILNWLLMANAPGLDFQRPAFWVWRALVHFNRFIIGPIGCAAVLGTTILGWMAVSQIRRSDGRLNGLRLAVFDGLLFPLCALFAATAYLLFTFGIGFLGWSHNYDPVHDSQLIVATCILSAVAAFAIVRWTWKRLGNREPSSGITWKVAVIIAVPMLLFATIFVGEKRRSRMAAAALRAAEQNARAATVDLPVNLGSPGESLDLLQKVLTDFPYGIWNKPMRHYSRNRRPDAWFALINLKPIDDSWVNPADLGLSVNASGEEVAAKANTGDLYAPDLDHLVGVRGTKLAPLKTKRQLEEGPPNDQNTMRKALASTTLREIANDIAAYDAAHTDDKWVRLEEGSRYGALRPDGELVLITAFGDGDSKNIQLIPVGKVGDNKSNK